MKRAKFGPTLFGGMIAATLFLAPKSEAVVFVEIFENYTDTGSGVEFSNFVGSFEAPAVDFVIGTGASWHPFGLSSFGARITGNLYMSWTDLRKVGLTSSDGSYLFLNGNLEVENGGDHDLFHVKSEYISFVAGEPNPFEIQFFNAPGGGPSGVDFGTYFQHGPFFAFDPSYFNPVPEPATCLGLASGLLLLKRRRARMAAK